ncbi:hypothetical protein [Methylorubrum aminovorans]
MIPILRIGLAALVITASGTVAAPAYAQSLTLPEIGMLSSGPCRQLAVRDQLTTPVAAPGCLDSGKWSLTPDMLQILGPSSTGDVAGMSATTKAGMRRTLLGKLADLPLTPQDMGATCNGTADDTAALNSLVGFLSEIIIASGTCRVAADVTWPRNKTIRIAAGASITVDAGRTLTIRSHFDAPFRQVFFGAGTVKGLRLAKPEWWGAQGAFGNNFDSQPAFQRAYEAARISSDPTDPINPSDGGLPVVEIGSGYYNLCRPWDLRPYTNAPIEVRGPGSNNSGGWLKPCASFTGYAVVQIRGIPKAEDPTYYVRLTDFSVQNVRGSGATVGLAFNPDGAEHYLYGPAKSLVENVQVYNFPVNIEVKNTGTLVFDRIASVVNDGTLSNSTAMRMRAVGSGSSANVSEVSIRDSRFVPCPVNNAAQCTNTVGLLLSAEGTQAGVNGVAAVTISATAFYGSNSGVVGRAINSGIINDIWLAPGTQFDGIGCQYVDFKATGSGKVNNINLTSVYHTATAPNCTAHTFVAEGGSSLMRGIFISNNWFIGIRGRIGNFYGTSGITYTGNQIHGDPSMQTAAAPIVFSLTRDFIATGNVLIADPKATVPFFFEITPGSSFGVIANNTGRGVRNAPIKNDSTAPSLITSPNIGSLD